MTNKINTIVRHTDFCNSVELSLFVKGGSIYENDSNAGITDFICGLLSKKLPGFSDDNLFEYLAKNTIDYCITTYREHVEVKISCPLEHYDKAFALLKAVFCCDEWTQDDIEANKKAVLTKLYFDGAYEPESSDLFTQNSHYTNHIAGTQETVNSFMTKQVNSMKKSIFSAEKSLLVVSGNTENIVLPKDLFSNSSYADVNAKLDIAPPEGYQKRDGNDILLYPTDSCIVNVDLGFDMPFCDINLCDYQLLADIMGLKLHDVLVEDKNLTPDVTVCIDLFPGFGRFNVAACFRTEDLLTGINEIMSVIADKSAVNEKTVLLKNYQTRELLNDTPFVEGRCPFVLGINKPSCNQSTVCELIKSLTGIQRELFSINNMTAFIEYNSSVNTREDILKSLIEKKDTGTVLCLDEK